MHAGKCRRPTPPRIMPAAHGGRGTIIGNADLDG
jgi:hypothetical protein